MAALGLALLTFASFVWAVRRLFRADEGMRGGMRAIALGGTASMALHLAALATGPGDGPLAALGLVLYGGALALFWSAAGVTLGRPLSLAFSTDRPAHLVMVGPYAHVRHPFYTAYLLAWIAGALASGEPALWVTVVGMGALYVRAARFEEAKFADSSLAAEYARYREQAGPFWPRARIAARVDGVARAAAGSGETRPAASGAVPPRHGP
jgi:protein-S-isoprenylcysteine O-methyltransferase Ste14